MLSVMSIRFRNFLSQQLSTRTHVRRARARRERERARLVIGKERIGFPEERESRRLVEVHMFICIYVRVEI